MNRMETFGENPRSEQTLRLTPGSPTGNSLAWTFVQIVPGRGLVIAELKGNDDEETLVCDIGLGGVLGRECRPVAVSASASTMRVPTAASVLPADGIISSPELFQSVGDATSRNAGLNVCLRYLSDDGISRRLQLLLRRDLPRRSTPRTQRKLHTIWMRRRHMSANSLRFNAGICWPPKISRA
jgi:hypothetical protein